MCGRGEGRRGGAGQRNALLLLNLLPHPATPGHAPSARLSVAGVVVRPEGHEGPEGVSRERGGAVRRQRAATRHPAAPAAVGSPGGRNDVGARPRRAALRRQRARPSAAPPQRSAQQRPQNSPQSPPRPRPAPLCLSRPGTATAGPGPSRVNARSDTRCLPPPPPAGLQVRGKEVKARRPRSPRGIRWPGGPGGPGGPTPAKSQRKLSSKTEHNEGDYDLSFQARFLCPRC